MNVDSEEIKKFEKLANDWWDKTSKFKPLHDINPLRVDYILKHSKDISNKKVLDVGCGGGLLSEALANKSAIVTGIDASQINIDIAVQHAK